MLCRICTVQIQPRKRVVDDTDHYMAPARQHELDRTRTDQWSICPERCRSWTVVGTDDLSDVWFIVPFLSHVSLHPRFGNKLLGLRVGLYLPFVYIALTENMSTAWSSQWRYRWSLGSKSVNTSISNINSIGAGFYIIKTYNPIISGFVRYFQVLLRSFFFFFF